MHICVYWCMLTCPTALGPGNKTVAAREWRMARQTIDINRQMSFNRVACACSDQVVPIKEQLYTSVSLWCTAQGEGLDVSGNLRWEVSGSSHLGGRSLVFAHATDIFTWTKERLCQFLTCPGAGSRGSLAIPVDLMHWFLATGHIHSGLHLLPVRSLQTSLAPHTRHWRVFNTQVNLYMRTSPSCQRSKRDTGIYRGWGDINGFWQDQLEPYHFGSEGRAWLLIRTKVTLS